MQELVAWLPPAVIIGVVIFTSNLTNKRIDDLRTQMSNDHKNLSEQVSEIRTLLIQHINDRSLHKP